MAGSISIFAFLLAHVAAPWAQQEPVKLTTGTLVEAQLLQNTPHQYAIQLSAGDYMEGVVEQKGVDAVVTVLDPDGGTVLSVDSPNGSKGPEPFGVQAGKSGRFTIQVAKLTPDETPGRYSIIIERVLNAEQNQQWLARIEADRRVVIDWFKQAAAPLSGVEPTDSVVDLEPFGRALDGVRIVGLGEASHGSRELFQVRHRLVQYLVEVRGYRTLAVELDLVAGRRLDDYVNGRVDTIDAALKPWETEEFISLLEYLRAYNARSAPADRVSVFGFDGQDRATGAAQVLDYLRRVAPERASETEALFADTRFPLQIPSEERDVVQRHYEDLFLFFDLSGAKLIAGSSASEYADMHALVRTMVQPGIIYADGQDQAALTRRDVYMAENFRRFVDAGGSDAGVIIWAHNGHVRAGHSGIQLMGYHLRGLYGQAYYALGTSFYEGQYQVWTSQRPINLDVVNAPVAAPGSAEETFIAVDADPYFIDFRGGSRPAAIDAWLAEPRLHRSAGGQYDRSRPPYYGVEVAIGEAFDGVVFVRRSTRAVPTLKLLNMTPQGLVAPPLPSTP